MKTDVQDLVSKYSAYCHALQEYNRVDNMLQNKKFHAKKTVVIGKKIDSLARKLIDSYLDAFILLLDESDLMVAEITAEYLYPLYPKKCFDILTAYKDTLTNNIDKYTIDSKIKGMAEGQKFFVDWYQELFGCKDIKGLNREK